MARHKRIIRTVKQVQIMTFSLTPGRIILEDLQEGDRSNLRLLARDPAFQKYVLVWLDTEEQIDTFLVHAIREANNENRRDYSLAAREKDTGAFAGLAFIEIDLRYPTSAEFGIALLPAFCKNGYGTEILESFLAFGFETLGMHRVYGKCDEHNIPSARLMERCGLVYEGTIREHVWLRDHWRSTRYYGMLAGEYFSRQ
jgi:RimJ/RimL family protein N-acetyltransferase